MPLTRYGIYRPKFDEWWCGGHRWSRSASPARWFESEREAESAVLRDLPDHRGEWIVKVVPVSRLDSSAWRA